MKLWQIFDRKEPKFWEKIDILTELLLATWLAVKYQLVGLESWLMRVGMCFLPFLLGLLLSFGRNGTVRMKTCLVGRHHLLISYYRKSRHFHYYETFFFFAFSICDGLVLEISWSLSIELASSYHQLVIII